MNWRQSSSKLAARHRVCPRGGRPAHGNVKCLSLLWADITSAWGQSARSCRARRERQRSVSLCGFQTGCPEGRIVKDALVGRNVWGPPSGLWLGRGKRHNLNVWVPRGSWSPMRSCKEHLLRVRPRWNLHYDFVLRACAHTRVVVKGQKSQLMLP